MMLGRFRRIEGKKSGYDGTADVMPYAEYGARDDGHGISGKVEGGQ